MVETIELPPFTPRSKLTIEDVVRDPAFRYSVNMVRVDLESLARVAFAAQGCTSRKWWRCLRAAPSAGATYPLRVYVAVMSVTGIEEGLYAYTSPAPKLHYLERVGALPRSTGEYSFTLFFEERPERTTSVYGVRGYMYVREEVGHAIQGAVLEASVLGLAVRVRRCEELEEFDGRVEYCLDVGGRGAPLLENPNPRESLLPAPLKPLLTLEEALLARRSVRRYELAPLRLREVSSILFWSSSLINAHRPYPPLRGSYRVSCYIVVRDVEDLKPGIYGYDSKRHSLNLIKRGNYARELALACLGQEWVEEAPINIVLSTSESVEEAEVEAGLLGHCIYIAATSINLGTVAIGAFYDDEVASVLGISERPLYVFPVGRPTGASTS